MKAKPEPGTVVQLATCANCGEQIRDLHGWHHAYTGEEEC